MKKIKIRITREGFATLFRKGCYVIRDGLPNDSSLIMFYYDPRYDIYWLTFETPFGEDTPEGGELEEILPVITRVET